MILLWKKPPKSLLSRGLAIQNHSVLRNFRVVPLFIIRCRFRRLKVAYRRVELVAAPRVAEPDDVAVVLGQRVCLYRLTGPRTGLVNAVGDVEVGHPISVIQISVPPCVLYVYLQF